MQKRHIFAVNISKSMFMASQILVFRTDLRNRRSAQKLCKSLQQQGLAAKATVDMQDCDRVLRVESFDAGARDIFQLALALGIHIEELE